MQNISVPQLASIWRQYWVWGVLTCTVAPLLPRAEFSSPCGRPVRERLERLCLEQWQGDSLQPQRQEDKCPSSTDGNVALLCYHWPVQLTLTCLNATTKVHRCPQAVKSLALISCLQQNAIVNSTVIDVSLLLDLGSPSFFIAIYCSQQHKGCKALSLVYSPSPGSSERGFPIPLWVEVTC